MVIKRGSNGKRHYILLVCKMTCLNQFLQYPLRRRRLILGRSVESRIPLEEFLFFFCFLSVYMALCAHI